MPVGLPDRAMARADEEARDRAEGAYEATHVLRAGSTYAYQHNHSAVCGLVWGLSRPFNAVPFWVWYGFRIFTRTTNKVPHWRV